MPSTKVMVRVTGGGTTGAWACGRGSRLWSVSGRRATGGRICDGVKRGAPGRCWPTPPDGRTPWGLCGGRTGCEGSGRGPPGGICGRIGGGYDGRCGAGRVDTPPGPPPGPPGLARLPVGGGGGVVGRGGTTLSDGRSRGPAGRVGIAGTAEVPGAVGSSIRSLMLGGTTRPGMWGGFAGAGAGGGAAATAAGFAGGGAGSTTGVGGGGSSTTRSGSGVGAATSGAWGGGGASATGIRGSSGCSTTGGGAC